MRSRANHPTRYGSCWVLEDIMSYPTYNPDWHKLNNGGILFKILVSEFEHITKTGGMFVYMISFSQPGFMVSKVQWNTAVSDRKDGYTRRSFSTWSLLPSLFWTILSCIWNHYLNRWFVYCHPVFRYDVAEQISTDTNKSASNWSAFWPTSSTRWQCGSIN